MQASTLEQINPYQTDHCKRLLKFYPISITKYQCQYSFSYLCAVVSKFQQHIARHKLCNKSDKILVAVSGGVDSIVMLDLLVQSGYHPAIAHCNFHLRGKESDGDEIFVRELAGRYALPLFVKQCPATEYANKKHISIEMAARDLRYTWFEELLNEHHFQKLAIGHNCDDDAETFFINLFRRSGLHGLKGIPVKRDRIIRPLLFASRQEILQYANDHHLHFREDSTNATDDYLRNRIRHHLLPFMETRFPGSRSSLAWSIEKLKDSDLLLKKLLEEKKQQLIESTSTGFRFSKKDILSFSESGLLLFYILQDYGFNRTQTDQINTSLHKLQTGQLFQSETHRLIIDRKYCFIESQGKNQQEQWPVEIKTATLNYPLKIKTELVANNKEFVLEKHKNIACFDADKISEPLYLRKWKQGDRFEPFGMRGSKLLSDYFIDEKFSRFEKENAWLLVSGNTILWIVGHRRSKYFNIGTKTKKILVFHLQHSPSGF